MNDSNESTSGTHAIVHVDDAEAADGSEPSIAAELRTLGERLAAAVRAAASTEEASALGNDVRDSVRRLRIELEEAMRKVPELARRGGEAASAEAGEAAAAASTTVGGGVQVLRREVGSAIAALGRTLERLGAALRVEDEAPADEDATDGSTA